MKADFEKWLRWRYVYVIEEEKYMINGAPSTDANSYKTLTEVVNQFAEDFAEQEYDRGYKDGFNNAAKYMELNI